MKKIPFKTDQNNPMVNAYNKAVEKGEKNQHILPRENGWIVKNLASGAASHLFETQEEAAKYAQSMATAGTAIFIHGVDGRIQDRKEY